MVRQRRAVAGLCQGKYKARSDIVRTEVIIGHEAHFIGLGDGEGVDFGFRIQGKGDGGTCGSGVIGDELFCCIFSS